MTLLQDEWDTPWLSAEGEDEPVGRLPTYVPSPSGASSNEPAPHPYIFLSHTGKDDVKDEIARPTAWFLTQVLEVEAFLDDGGLDWGDHGKERALSKHAYTCSHALVVLSPKFRQRSFCVKELNTFMHRIRTEGVGSFRMLVALWMLENTNGYHSEVDENIRIRHDGRSVEYYLTQTLWPQLIKALGKQALSDAELKEHFLAYIKLNWGGPRPLPQDFLRLAKDMGVPSDAPVFAPELQATPRPYDVFICHGGPDKEFAASIFTALQAKSVSSFFDEVSLRESFGTPNVPDMIKEAMNECRVAVIVLSDTVVHRQYPLQEMVDLMERRKAEKSKHHGLKILPLFYDITTDACEKHKETVVQDLANINGPRLKGERLKLRNGRQENKSSEVYVAEVVQRVMVNLYPEGELYALERYRRNLTQFWPRDLSKAYDVLPWKDGTLREDGVEVVGNKLVLSMNTRSVNGLYADDVIALCRDLYSYYQRLLPGIHNKLILHYLEKALAAADDRAMTRHGYKGSPEAHVSKVQVGELGEEEELGRFFLPLAIGYTAFVMAGTALLTVAISGRSRSSTH